MLDKRCRLLKTYPGFTEEYVAEQLTTAQGWAYYAWAYNEAAAAGGDRLVFKSKGYIAQEAERIKQHG